MREGGREGGIGKEKDREEVEGERRRKGEGRKEGRKRRM